MMPPEGRHGGEEAERPLTIANVADDARPRPAPPLLPRRRKRFVLFGDSITQQSFSECGWGARLADAYARKADVVLRGYSGYNTEWALALVPEVFLLPEGGNISRRPNALVSVFFGANDAALADGASARQHVRLARFKENLTTIVRSALGTLEPGGLVILCSCPPVDEGQRARRLAEFAAEAVDRGGSEGPKPPLPLPERTNEAARLYSRAAAEVAEAFSRAEAGATAADPPLVAFLDLWEQLAGAASPVASTVPNNGDGSSSFLSDGLHLSAAGNDRVFGCLSAAIAQHRPQLRAEELEIDFPDWSCSDLKPCPR